jgi:microcystin-dependent protein
MAGNVKISNLPEVATLLDTDIFPLVTLDNEILTTKIITAENLRNELGGGSSAAEILPLVYPVGSIFMNTIATNPATIFGFGTWVAWGTGRVPVGVDTGQSEFNTVEKTGGSKTHTLSTDEMPAHTHTQNAHTHTQNSHNHTQNAHTHTQNSHNHTQNAHTHTQPGHSHAMSGQGGYYGVAMMSSEGGVGRLVTTDSGVLIAEYYGNTGGANPSTYSQKATNQSETATNQNTTPTNNSATATNNSTVATNQSSGNGSAHNNLQPYITCYMWKRTA